MFSYIVRRFIYIIPILIIVSILSFTIIKLQPGEFGSQYLKNPNISAENIEEMRQRLGLDKPAYMQYLHWVKGIITKWDFGYSFTYKRPVSELIGERMMWTIVVALSTMLFTWTLGIPIGIFSATHKYSIFDHVLTFIGFLGMSIPNFFLALILMFIIIKNGGASVGGLFSSEFIGQPWSIAKFIDLVKHIWIPMIAIGTAGTATILRQMRGNLFDVLRKQYVTTARAKGLKERKVIYKHAVRNAINPLISLLGMRIPYLISGTIISSIVLNLPTMGPFFYDSLLNHDQYVVMTFLIFSAFLMIIGNLIADILLAVSDPSIRYD